MTLIWNDVAVSVPLPRSPRGPGDNAGIEALSFLCHLSLSSFSSLPPAYPEHLMWMLGWLLKCSEVKLISAGLRLAGTAWKPLFREILLDV